MADRKSTAAAAPAAPKHVAGVDEHGAVETKNTPHPTDARIWSDGRPRLVKGNPYAPGTGAFVAWESGIGHPEQ